MIVLKLPTSGNDQAKGSDGIFCGDYMGKPAILLGESKTYTSLADAVRIAFTSLDRFYSLTPKRCLKLTCSYYPACHAFASHFFYSKPRSLFEGTVK
jgi:hypothetical protein